MAKKRKSLREFDAQKGDSRILDYTALHGIATGLGMEVPINPTRQRAFLEKHRDILTQSQDIEIK